MNTNGLIKLSEVVDYTIIDGAKFWIVAETSDYIRTRDNAFRLARERFPDLINDENE